MGWNHQPESSCEMCEMKIGSLVSRMGELSGELCPLTLDEKTHRDKNTPWRIIPRTRSKWVEVCYFQ